MLPFASSTQLQPPPLRQLQPVQPPGKSRHTGDGGVQPGAPQQP